MLPPRRLAGSWRRGDGLGSLPAAEKNEEMGPWAHFLLAARTAGRVARRPMKAQLIRLLEPAIEAAGYELVELEFSPASARALLRVYIDRTDGENVNVDDCAAASRAISAVLDVADPIERAYALEVSSPGFDRPLRKRAHFERFLGSEARVELSVPLEGRKRFKGQLVAVEGDELVMEVDERSWRLPLEQVEKARLVA